jgi:hypothetical protein
MIPFSILDLSPIAAGGTPADALHRSLDLAQHAERWGYRRYWLAEHHNMTGIASAATSVVIGYVAGGTKTIRVGSGGVMLPALPHDKCYRGGKLGKGLSGSLTHKRGYRDNDNEYRSKNAVFGSDLRPLPTRRKAT